MGMGQGSLPHHMGLSKNSVKQNHGERAKTPSFNTASLSSLSWVYTQKPMNIKSGCL